MLGKRKIWQDSKQKRSLGKERQADVLASRVLMEKKKYSRE